MVSLLNVDNTGPGGELWFLLLLFSLEKQSKSEDLGLEIIHMWKHPFREKENHGLGVPAWLWRGWDEPGAGLFLSKPP